MINPTFTAKLRCLKIWNVMNKARDTVRNPLDNLKELIYEIPDKNLQYKFHVWIQDNVEYITNSFSLEESIEKYYKIPKEELIYVCREANYKTQHETLIKEICKVLDIRFVKHTPQKRIYGHGIGSIIIDEFTT